MAIGTLGARSRSSSERKGRDVAKGKKRMTKRQAAKVGGLSKKMPKGLAKKIAGVTKRRS